jgi:hypothetical protein
MNENDNGKTIRINNLKHELAKLPDIIALFKKSESTTLSRLTPEIVSQYMQVYAQIKKIDKELYDAEMSVLLENIINVSKEKTRVSISMMELLYCYEQLVENVIKPYFSETADIVGFSIVGYPEYIKNRIMHLARSEILNSSHSIQNMMTTLGIMEDAGMFTFQYVDEIITCTINRAKKSYRTPFVRVVEDDIDEFIELMENVKKLGINVSRFMRFVIIQQLKDEDDIDVLYYKKMLYQFHNEIPITNYIGSLIAKCKRTDVDEMVFIDGMCDTADFKYKLDIYYLTKS